jgi:hypothetical protein
MTSRTAGGGERGRTVLHLAVLGGYAALSTVLFGWRVLPDPAHAYVGTGADPAAFMWFLTWWPHAIARGANPFVADAVWAPLGTHLAWTTAVPGLALLAAPITILLGPVVAYNVVALAAPALSAWAAYLLCRSVTAAVWPALAGGYLFGFSTYAVGHVFGHLHMTMVAGPPLALYLTLRHVSGTLARGPFLAWLSLVLVLQFLVSTEVYATQAIFGAGAMLLAFLVLGRPAWRRLAATGGLVAGAYALSALAVSPYLYHVLAAGVPAQPIHPLTRYSTDLLNLVVPTPITWLGGRAFADVAGAFTGGNLFEHTGYVGLPLLAVVLAFAWRHRGHAGGRLLVLALAAVWLASLGPALRIAGRESVALPWALAAQWPFINNALPARFTMYAFLLLALIVAIWLGAETTARRRRWALVLAGLAFLVPDVSLPLWRSDVDTPRFFASGLYRQHVAAGETIVVVPFGHRGNSMLWQAQTAMYFRMAGGYVGIAPAHATRWPIVHTLHTGEPIPEQDKQLAMYLGAHGVSQVIVVDGREGRRWADTFTRLDPVPSRVEDVWIFRVPAAVRVRYADGERALRQDAVERFGALLGAADGYLGRGLRPENLTPLEAQDLDLLPRDWGGFEPTRAGAQFWTRNGLWLGPWERGTVAAGIVGGRDELHDVLARWGADAERVYFPYPAPLAAAPARDVRGQLLMVFTEDGLARAARRR